MARRGRLIRVEYQKLELVTGGWCEPCGFPSMVLGMFVLEVNGKPQRIETLVWCDDCRRQVEWEPGISDDW